MKIDEIKAGSKININDKIYYVLQVVGDADVETKNGQAIIGKEYICLELSCKNNGSYSTHQLKYYEDTGEALLYHIRKVKFPEGIQYPITNIKLTEYKLIKILKESDIKCL